MGIRKRASGSIVPKRDQPARAVRGGRLRGYAYRSGCLRLIRSLAAGDITDSLAFTIVGWPRKLPAGLRTETDRILLEAAAAGASTDDLATIAACAIETWRRQRPKIAAA